MIAPPPPDPKYSGYDVTDYEPCPEHQALASYCYGGIQSCPECPAWKQSLQRMGWAGWVRRNREKPVVTEGTRR